MEQNNNSTEEQVQTVNYVGEEAYKALYRRLSTQIAGTKGDTEAIIANLGSMSVGDMTIRELLDAIKTDALTPTQLTEANNAIISLIGAASDSSEASTVFGKIAEAIRIISETKETNTKILEEVQKIPDLRNIYSARFVKNDDGEDTYSMVLPIVAGVVANEDGETVTIKL